ncbi:uncharacterized protein N7477_002704 [Penicillium maclennaniae]|uniref:uncharacterized protein n=1 Tax=Penicillium maclennaniae TaxID=1343394 RepID=UPI00254067FC|nr:uncharacterized protein N7477_002704 [Penicillium maclennaniae]KAJ5677071.1 hypothetical protein N7477_002704 [Penicillium maclennaniae]
MHVSSNENTGPNERRTISREDVGFYNALVIAAVYEIADENVDVVSTQSFISPVKHCIQEHPFLSVVVKNKHTETPAFEGVSTMNLEDHISIVHDETSDETAAFQKILPPILDRPWPADVPPWRIVVLPLASHDFKVKRCFIVFSFSHTLGDGMVGMTFHRTFLNVWQKNTIADLKESFLVTPPKQVLTAPFDTPERLPISWKFLLAPLLAVYFPRFLNNLLGLRPAVSTVDDGTWIGAPIFVNPKTTTRLRILEIEAQLVKNALQAARSHDAKLTATMHLLITRALSQALTDPKINNFVSGTAVDMRSSVGIPAYTWGLFVNGHYEVHPRIHEIGPGFSDAMWASASSITKRLAECHVRLHDQAIGLLRYVPSIRKWIQKKIGHERDCSFEFSNLLAFDGGGNPDCSISKMVFSRPANPISAPMDFNIISVKGGSLVCTISWQAGAWGVPIDEESMLVDGICSSLRRGFEAF